MNSLDSLFDSNQKWAEDIKKVEPGFFHNLAQGQSPDYLWIGCADSRVPATQLLGLSPGDVFVHRNIANIVVHSDLNALSVLQYAVEIMKVKHVLICGHYGCGGVKAAMGEQDNGLIDNWLNHIRDVARQHKNKLAGLSEQERHDLLCELNVRKQVDNVSRSAIVQQAWVQGADLTIHSLIYDLEKGLVKDLEYSKDGTSG